MFSINRSPCPPAEHQNLQQRLEKKERECEAKNKEKDDMLEMLNKMKDKLERESRDHKEAKTRVAELSARLQQLSSVRDGLIGDNAFGTSTRSNSKTRGWEGGQK